MISWMNAVFMVRHIDMNIYMRIKDFADIEEATKYWGLFSDHQRRNIIPHASTPLQYKFKDQRRMTNLEEFCSCGQTHLHNYCS